jgi:hypothetical protein
MTSENHSFSVQLATDLGSVDLALVLNHFLHWIGLNKRKGTNLIDGRTWTYDTLDNIALHFPYYKPHQVKYFIKVLVDKGILIKANHNKFAFDKTTWYAFADESKWSFSNYPYERENSPTEERKLPNGEEKSVTPIPKSKPSSKPSSIKDQGQETKAIKKERGKTLDPARRWKLTDEQKEAYSLIESLGTDADDGKIAFWVKTYSVKRIMDAYNESKGYKPNSMSQYMSKLLDENRVLPNANANANREFAKDFMKMNKWHGPKIHKTYVKIPIGADYAEVSLNMEPADFVHRLMEKFDNSKD